MKLHCPHCGVKGSAEDSYIGRKVKCPKCQGVFEVLGDMASEPPADASFAATLSPLPAQIPGAAEQEETLDWEDIASEIDLQLAEATMGEEQEGSLQDGPVGLSSFEEDFAKPVDDFDLIDEIPPLDVDDGELDVDDGELDIDDGESPADPSYAQVYEQVPGEMLNAERPSGGDKELPDDSISGYDNEKSSGKTTFQVWAKVRAALAKWFGK